MSKKNVSILVNPQAGQGSGGTMASKVLQIISQRGDTGKIFTSKDKKDLEHLAKKVAGSNCDQLVVIGGDGTLNTVVNGLFENGKALAPELPLAIVPGGSGCDYFRGISQNRKKTWQEILLNYQTKKIDVAVTKFTGIEFKQRYFLNMTGIGLSAKIVEKKNKNPPWLPKDLSYVLPGITQILSYPGATVKVTTPTQTWDKLKVLAIFASKGPFAGGGMLLGPHANWHDAQLAITMIENGPLLKKLWKFPKVINGKTSSEESIHRIKAPWMEVSASPPLMVECDGEIEGCTPLRIEVLPNALTFCFPID